MEKTALSWAIITCWSADGTLLSQKAACDKSDFQGQTFHRSDRLGHPPSDGGQFHVEERLHVRPDLVGFCPGECLKHTFTPGGGNGEKRPENATT